MLSKSLGSKDPSALNIQKKSVSTSFIPVLRALPYPFPFFSSIILQLKLCIDFLVKSSPVGMTTIVLILKNSNSSRTLGKDSDSFFAGITNVSLFIIIYRYILIFFSKANKASLIIKYIDVITLKFSLIL